MKLKIDYIERKEFEVWKDAMYRSQAYRDEEFRQKLNDVIRESSDNKKVIEGLRQNLEYCKSRLADANSEITKLNEDFCYLRNTPKNTRKKKE